MWNSYNSFGSGMHMPIMAGAFAPFIFLLAALVIALKGYALWHAAKRSEMWWFVALLVLNTAGILELVYIIFFLKKFSTKPEAEVVMDDNKAERINDSK